MSEFEFSEAEEKKIDYYVKVLASCFDTLREKTDLLDAKELAVVVFQTVIKSDAAEGLNKIAAEAMEYLRKKEEEAGKAADEARESLHRITVSAPIYKPENPRIARMRSLVNMVFDIMAWEEEGRRHLELNYLLRRAKVKVVSGWVVEDKQLLLIGG